MTPDTIESLVIVIVALLPGALVRSGYEHVVGTWLVTAWDRVVWYVTASLLVSPLPVGIAITLADHVERLAAKEPDLFAVAISQLDWRLGLLGWLGLAAALSFFWGVGYGLGRLRVGPLREPLGASWPREASTFDWLFSDASEKLVVANLDDDSWVGGYFGARSWVAPTHSPHTDLFLEVAVEVDEHGDVRLDADDRPTERGRGLYIDQRHIRRIEWIDLDASSNAGE